MGHASEVYLGPYQTSMVELFYFFDEIRQWLKAVFSKEAPL